MLGFLLKLVGLAKGGKKMSRKEKKAAAYARQRKLFRERMAFEHAMENVERAKEVTERSDSKSSFLNTKQRLDVAKEKANSDKAKNKWQDKIKKTGGTKLKSGELKKGVNSMRKRISRSRNLARARGAEKGLC